MFPGACPLKHLAWIQYGLSIKIFAGLKQMKPEAHLTCLQVSDKEIDL